MKRQIRSLLILTTVLTLLYACVDPVDLVTEDALEGGGILTLAGSNGKVLGVPSGSGEVTFTDNSLSLAIDMTTGGGPVTKYTVVKQFKGGNEIVVEEFNSVPHATSLATLAQFLEGTGATASSLRIGDAFIFTVKMTLDDGRVVYAAPAQGRYQVVINCSSNLAATYTVTGTYTRPSLGTSAVGPRTEVITEISAGNYAAANTGERVGAGWGVVCPMFFSDVCGELTIESQYLCDAFANLVEGTGTVDPATGDIHFEYSIAYPDLASDANPRTYVLDYVRQ